MGTAPYTLAMIVCEAVHRDPTTGKWVLVNTFSSIGAETFPATHPSMAVFVNLTDGRGRANIRLRLIDADEEGDPLFESGLDVDFNDPRGVVELAFVLGNIAFPRAGEYRLILTADGVFLMERRVLVVSTGQEGIEYE